ALCAVEAERQVQVVPEMPARRRRQAAGVEVARWADGRARVHLDPVAVVACAGFQVELAERAPPHPEQPEVTRLRIRHEGLVADRAEVALRCLYPEGAIPAGPVAMDQLDAQLRAVVVEHRADL